VPCVCVRHRLVVFPAGSRANGSAATPPTWPHITCPHRAGPYPNPLGRRDHVAAIINAVPPPTSSFSPLSSTTFSSDPPQADDEEGGARSARGSGRRGGGIHSPDPNPPPLPRRPVPPRSNLLPPGEVRFLLCSRDNSQRKLVIFWLRPIRNAAGWPDSRSKGVPLMVGWLGQGLGSHVLGFAKASCY
jgi:hypothetical protein